MTNPSSPQAGEQPDFEKRFDFEMCTGLNSDKFPFHMDREAAIHLRECYKEIDRLQAVSLSQAAEIRGLVEALEADKAIAEKICYDFYYRDAEGFKVDQLAWDRLNGMLNNINKALLAHQSKQQREGE